MRKRKSRVEDPGRMRKAVTTRPPGHLPAQCEDNEPRSDCQSTLPLLSDKKGRWLETRPATQNSTKRCGKSECPICWMYGHPPCRGRRQVRPGMTLPSGARQHTGKWPRERGLAQTSRIWLCRGGSLYFGGSRASRKEESTRRTGLQPVLGGLQTRPTLSACG